MKAMVLEKQGHPLVMREVPKPEPQADEVLIRVLACGVCRTDLHIVDGELKEPKLPLILGHQVVGVIEKIGSLVSQYKIGERVGVPWLGNTCQACEFCLSHRENLCDSPHFTGYTLNGGYAEFCTANVAYVLKLPANYDDLHAAPLLCAGLIGYRAYRLLGQVMTLGLYGFGSSAHILIQVAKYLGNEVYVFTRPGDKETQVFARSLGAIWAGGSDELPPCAIDGALIFAPVGALYPQALKAVKKGARVVSAGIHMSPIPTFSYDLLWNEKSMSSVANLTRHDGHDFMQLASKIPLQVSVTPFALEEANLALAAIRNGSLEGSAVLKI